MFTILATYHNSIEMPYLTGFYNSLNEANNAVIAFQNNIINYKIIELNEITSFPFYIIELNNKFHFFKDEISINEFISSNKFEKDEDDVYFIFYKINKECKSLEGKDIMGTWFHEHITDIDFTKKLSC